MSEALRYERIRMLSIRSAWIVGAIFLVVAIGLPWLFAADAPEATVPDATQIHIQIAWVLALTIGALAIGPEYRHGTIRLALTEYPRRGVLFAAKLIGAVTTVAILGFVGWALGWLIGDLLLDESVDVADQFAILVRNVGVLVGWTAIGFAAAAILRSTALGVVLPLLFALIVENLLPFLLSRRELVEWFPFYSSNLILSADEEMWRAVAVFAAWAIGLVALAWALFRYRDA